MEKKLHVQEKNTELTVQLESLLCAYMKSHSIKAAIELGIADNIHSCGQSLTAFQLAAKIPLSPSVDVSCLDRLMCLLVQIGVFAEEEKLTDENAREVSYGLTPLSKLLLRESPRSMAPLAMLSIHPLSLSSWDNLAAWFQSGDRSYPTAFKAKHGKPLRIQLKSDPFISRVFDEAMSSSSKLIMSSVVEECSEVFDGVTSLVDVGGGNGPLCQPRVLAASSPLPNDTTIAGNMFESVPPADAVFLKRILHNWDDNECVKILKLCKEAIPKLGGKVIIVDIVIKNCGDQVLNEVHLMLDLHMMVLLGGKERNEEEWKKLFVDAGFSTYKIVATVGLLYVVEVFP
ncbi:unnamed protein product [Victoria cruziana]